jgi:hypothetical protein
MDLVFAVATMENYLKYLTVNQIGGVLMDVTNNLLELPKAYLREASYRHQSCMKLINITEQLAGTSSTSLLHKVTNSIFIVKIKKCVKNIQAVIEMHGQILTMSYCKTEKNIKKIVSKNKMTFTF